MHVSVCGYVHVCMCFSDCVHGRAPVCVCLVCLVLFVLSFVSVLLLLLC